MEMVPYVSAKTYEIGSVEEGIKSNSSPLTVAWLLSFNDHKSQCVIISLLMHE